MLLIVIQVIYALKKHLEDWFNRLFGKYFIDTSPKHWNSNRTTRRVNYAPYFNWILFVVLRQLLFYLLSFFFRGWPMKKWKRENTTSKSRRNSEPTCTIFSNIEIDQICRWNQFQKSISSPKTWWKNGGPLLGTRFYLHNISNVAFNYYTRLAYWLVSLLATKSARVRGPPRAKNFHR